MKSVVADLSAYDHWQDDSPLRGPSARTSVYEMHVRGFTRHPSSGVAPIARTFAGAIDRLAGQLGEGREDLTVLVNRDFQDVVADAPPGRGLRKEHA